MVRSVAHSCWSLAVLVLALGLHCNGGEGAIQEDRLLADFEKAVKFYQFSSASPSGAEVGLDVESLTLNGFNKSLTTTILIHGYGHNITDPFFKAVGGALLETDARTNLLGVDWGVLCPKPHYLLAKRSVAGVGRRVAVLVRFLVDSGLARLADVHLVGHSLGAHVAGNAGKEVKVGRITGLDPAQPLFTSDASDRLTSSDADLVDVIHTCIGLLGYKEPLGHVDFYPNGGRIFQPGCGLADGLRFGHCSHTRSYKLFGESIRDPQAFPATFCGSYKKAVNKSCPWAGATAYMGYRLQFQQPGVYYLKTTESSPFKKN